MLVEYDSRRLAIQDPAFKGYPELRVNDYAHRVFSLAVTGKLAVILENRVYPYQYPIHLTPELVDKMPGFRPCYPLGIPCFGCYFPIQGHGNLYYNVRFCVLQGLDIALIEAPG